jgi:hypothetical protein
MVGALVLVVHAGRGTTFSYDEWDFVATRFGWGPDVLLAPHNDHLSVVPLLAFKVVLETAGLGGYTILRIVTALLDLTCGLLFLVYVGRRIGSWPAVALASALMVMGPGAWDILWPFQIGFLGSVAAALGAFIALDRQTRAGDVSACALATLALACSGIGVAVLVAVAVELLWRGDWRRWWVAAIPAALFAAWYAAYGVSNLSVEGLGQVPIDVWGGLTSSSAAITGMPHAVGGGLALVVVVVAGVAFWRSPAQRPRLLALAAVPVVFWTLVAITRGIAPEQSRYLYPAGVFVALLAAEAFRVVAPPSRRAAVVVTGLLAIGAVHNATGLGKVGDILRASAHTTRVSLTAADRLLATRADPSAAIPGVPYLTLRRWRTVRRRYGSP